MATPRSSDPSGPHPQGSPDESALRKKEEVEGAEPSSGGSGGEGDDAFLEDLQDPENATRLGRAQTRPREAPEPVVRELGEEASSLPAREPGVLTDLNARTGVAPKFFTESGKETEGEGRSRPREKAVKPSRREERRRAREERRQRRAAAKGREGEKPAGVSEAEALEGGVTGEKRGGEPARGRGSGEGLRMDDLDMENPLPEAAYTPQRDHGALVMDRKRRRLEAAARLEAKEKESQVIWERDDADGSVEALLARRQFSLPVYLVQSVFVVMGVFLLIMGLMAAFRSSRDAAEGVVPTVTSGAAAALGWLEAKQVAEDFLQADGWEAKLPYVRNPERAREKMERYYGEHPEEAAGRTVLRLGADPRAMEGGYGFRVRADLEGDQRVTVPVVRFDAESPRFVVDWESYVHYAEVDWVTFLRERKPGSRGIYRLYGMEEPFYVYGFGEEAYRSVQLIDSEKRQGGFGYLQRPPRRWEMAVEEGNEAAGSGAGAGVRVTEEQVRAWSTHDAVMSTLRFFRADLESRDLGRKAGIDETLWMPRLRDVWAPMTLEVAFPEEEVNAMIPQVKIERFLSHDWVIPSTLTEASSGEGE